MGAFEIPRGQEVLILVGLPASGKTTFRRGAGLESRYSTLSKDERPGAERQLKELAGLLDKGRSVVVDNTNASAAERRPVITAARAAGVPCRAVFFDTPKDEAARRNAGRGAAKVPPVAMNAIAKKLQPPSTAEGLSSVVVATPAGEWFDFKAGG